MKPLPRLAALQSQVAPLETERRRLERELTQGNDEIRGLLQQIIPSDGALGRSTGADSSR